MTGTENRPGKKARSLSRKRMQEKREWWWWWGLHKNTLQPFKVCKFSSILLSMSPYGSDSSLSRWPCIYLSLFPPLGLPTVTIHPSMALSGSPPPFPSSPGGELVPPSQVVHPLTKGTNESSRSSPAYGVDVRRPCHQRHQMSPDFCSVSSETLLSLYLPLA